MRGVVRTGDTYEGWCDHGVEDCCPHYINGEYVAGSPDTKANGRSIVRVGDETHHTGCPHCSTGVAGGGSANQKCNGNGIHLAGDPVTTGGGVSQNTSSSANVKVNG